MNLLTTGRVKGIAKNYTDLEFEFDYKNRKQGRDVILLIYIYQLFYTNII